MLFRISTNPVSSIKLFSKSISKTFLESEIYFKIVPKLFYWIRFWERFIWTIFVFIMKILNVSSRVESEKLQFLNIIDVIVGTNWIIYFIMRLSRLSITTLLIESWRGIFSEFEAAIPFTTSISSSSGSLSLTIFPSIYWYHYSDIFLLMYSNSLKNFSKFKIS